MNEPLFTRSTADCGLHRSPSRNRVRGGILARLTPVVRLVLLGLGVAATPCVAQTLTTPSPSSALVPPSSAAQNSPRQRAAGASPAPSTRTNRWEFEIHGGGQFGTRSSDGTA